MVAFWNVGEYSCRSVDIRTYCAALIGETCIFISRIIYDLGHQHSRGLCLSKHAKRAAELQSALAITFHSGDSPIPRGLRNEGRDADQAP